MSNLATYMGVSRERVRQIEAKAIRRIHMLAEMQARGVVLPEQARADLSLYGPHLGGAKSVQEVLIKRVHQAPNALGGQREGGTQ
jgi:hypothetical protein